MTLLYCHPSLTSEYNELSPIVSICDLYIPEVSPSINSSEFVIQLYFCGVSVFELVFSDAEDEVEGEPNAHDTKHLSLLVESIVKNFDDIFTKRRPLRATSFPEGLTPKPIGKNCPNFSLFPL